uniref:Protein kinase domain-containing protein n=1 Tax=Parascaris univalens TaxID=6257 RepID=A0A915CDH2_PARUN
ARRMATKDDEGSVSVDEKHALAEHLRSIAPFNKRWQFTGIERKLKVTQASLQLLKGIHDMHREGLLHRDLKPDNMGILSREQPFVVLFDLGMTRMYTDEVGQVRLPRTTCPFRGTPEWASGWAQKGRDKSGFNDLIGWLFVCCELYDSSPITIQPLPWTYRRSSKVTKTS